MLFILFIGLIGFTGSSKALASAPPKGGEISSIYRTVLGREASREEIAYWESTGLSGNPLLNTIMSSAQGSDIEAVARYRQAEAEKGIPKNPDPEVKAMLEQAKKDGQAAREALARGEDTMPWTQKYLPSAGRGNTGADNPLLWGAWIEGITTAPGASFQDIASFNAMTGKKAAVEGLTTWWYVDADWGDFNTLYNNPAKPGANWANEVYSRGAIPMIMWQPMDPSQSLACEDKAFLDRIRKFSPKNIAKGDFDPYIRKWARQIKEWGKPLHIRMMHELNYSRILAGPCEYFTSWDAELVIKGERINSPQDSVDAWKHIVDLFRAEGATNVKWVWSVLSFPSGAFGGKNPLALQTIYPGDKYVDWIGIECYNFKNEDWLNCRDRMSGIYREAAALSAKVPLLVAEMGAYEDPRKAAWLTDALSDSSPNAIQKLFPRITAVMYWNDSRYDGLWIKSSKNSIDAVKAALAGSSYRAKGSTEEVAAGAATESAATKGSKKGKSATGDIYAEITGDEPSAVESQLLSTSFTSGVSPRDIRIEISNSADVRSRLSSIYQKEYGKAPSHGALKAMSEHIAKGGTVDSVRESIQSFAPGSDLVAAAENGGPTVIVVGKAEDSSMKFGSISKEAKSSESESEESSDSGRSPASSGQGNADSAGPEQDSVEEPAGNGGAATEKSAGSSATESQIRRIYREVLGREPDSGGLDYWTKQLESGAMSYDQVKAAIQNSDEGKKKSGSGVKSAI